MLGFKAWADGLRKTLGQFDTHINCGQLKNTLSYFFTQQITQVWTSLYESTADSSTHLEYTK